MSKTAAILTIGTEITTGEIVNSNAAWISQRLTDWGYELTQHLTVRDVKEDIVSALRSLSHIKILIVTGGLGPTSDDLTREMVAKWSDQPLEFSNLTWDELNSLYKSRGLQIREAHKHQCYFPRGAIILKNPVGTAHGFCLKMDATQVFVLPGPPRELEGMWPAVESHLSKGSQLPWHHWSIIGMPESEVAEIVEPLIEGKSIEVGYRASVPYVHLKLRGKAVDDNLKHQIEQKFEGRIAFKDKFDFVSDLVRRIGNTNCLIQDQITDGLIAGRLRDHIRKNPSNQIRILQVRQNLSLTMEKPLAFASVGGGPDPFSFEIKWLNGTKNLSETIKIPFKTEVSTERGAKIACEWFLYKLWLWLQ